MVFDRKEYYRFYSEENPNYYKEYYKKNKDKIKEASKKWKQENKDKAYATRKKLESTPGWILKKKAYLEKHKDRANALRRKNRKRKYLEDKDYWKKEAAKKSPATITKERVRNILIGMNVRPTKPEQIMID
ncbi:hypothetical protein LCGC14_0622360, partial [marine sediment metagenome]